MTGWDASAIVQACVLVMCEAKWPGEPKQEVTPEDQTTRTMLSKALTCVCQRDGGECPHPAPPFCYPKVDLGSTSSADTSLYRFSRSARSPTAPPSVRPGMLLRLPIAVLDFAFIIALFALAFGGLALVIVVALGVGTEIGSWTIDTFSESLIFVPLSVVFLLLGARLIVGWAGLSRRFAAHFLGRVDLADLKHEVAEILARDEEADAFRILDELEFRLGHGPLLTPIRVQATLVALQSSGHVVVRNDGPRTIYTLT